MGLFRDYDIEPIGNFLVLKRRVVSDRTEGGLILPEQAQGTSNVAEVLAVGPGLFSADGTRQPMQTSVGDTVIIDKFSGQPITVEGEEVLVARETEVIGVFRKAAD